MTGAWNHESVIPRVRVGTFGPRRVALPTLATARLRLRALGPADAPALLALFGDPAVSRHWGRPPLEDLASAAALEREIAGRVAGGGLLQWGIVERDSDALVGTAALALAPGHQRAEVGLALAPAARGRGYIAEALPALIDLAFGALGLNRLEAEVEPDNSRCIRALERAGFRREGMLRERYVVDGVAHDAVAFGLLRRDRAAA